MDEIKFKVTSSPTVQFSSVNQLVKYQGGENNLKRAITGIVAAGLALGMMAPAAFAATTSSSTLTASGGKTISLDGSALYTGVQAGTAKDAGTTTTYFPIWYLEQALTKAGYVNSYNASTHTWNLQIPGVNAANVAVDGGVGTGNSAIAINGIVVKKFNAQWHKDFAGGKDAVLTTYFPLYYLGNVLSAAGFSNAWDGTSFGFTSNYGQAAGLSLKPATTDLVANNTTADAIALNVVDANGHVVRDYSGNVTISQPSHGTLEDANGNALSFTNGVATVAVTNGSANLQLVSANTPVGDSDTLTATFTPTGATNTVSTSATVNYVAQAASTVGLSITSGDAASLSVNSANSSTSVHVILKDQAGNAMTSGGAYVTLTLSGPGSFVSGSAQNTYTTWVGVGGADVTVYGNQGVSGTVSVSASSTGLTGGSIAIPAVVNTAPAAIRISGTPGTDGNGNPFTLYTATLVDSNGNVVDNSSDTVAISDNAANGSGALAYYSGNVQLVSGVPTGNGSNVAPTLMFSHGVAQFAVETTTVGTGTVTITGTEGTSDFTAKSTYGYQVGAAAQVAPVSSVSPSVKAGTAQQVSFQLEDGNGNAVKLAGQAVTFTLTQGNATASFPNGNTSTYTATTDANGVATVTVDVGSASNAGTVTIVGTYNNTASQTDAYINVVGAPDYVTSMAFNPTWAVSNTSKTAGGTFSNLPTVDLENAIGSAVSSHDEFEISSSNYNVISFAQAGSWSADGTGAYDLTVNGATSFSLPTINAGLAGSATVTIKDLSNSSVPALTETLTSTVGQATSTPWVEYQGKAISSSNPLTVAANTPVQLTVVNVDAGGNPVPVNGTGQVVELSDSNGGSYRLTATGAAVNSVTIPAGQSSVTVYYVNGTAQTIESGLAAGNQAVSATNTSVAVTNSTVTAGGNFVVSGVVKDQNGHVLSGQTVTVAFDGKTGTAISDSNGAYSVTLVPTTVTASSAVTVTVGQTPITTSATGTVNAAAPATLSSFSYDNTTITGSAGGTATATVVVKDQYNNTADNTGTFAVSAPAAAVQGTDYTFNTTTGQLVILAGSTATGTYTVTYTNGTSSSVTGTATVTVQ